MNGLAAALKVLSEKLHIPKNFEIKLTIGQLNEKKLDKIPSARRLPHCAGKYQ